MRIFGWVVSAVLVAAFGHAAGLFVAQAQGSLVAAGTGCRGQQNARASEHVQQTAMRCLINHARKSAGAGGLTSSRRLERAAGRKAHDVIRCGFSHTACGSSADRWPRRYGYMSGTSSWQWGENLAWGAKRRGTARQVLKSWLASPPHRSTMLRGSFDDLGIGLRRGRFAGRANAAVWVLEVGCRGC